MKHLFVPLDMAVILKEKGFDEPCFKYFNERHPHRYTTDNEITTNSELARTITHAYITIPLYTQVIDWLRDKHNLNVWVTENPYTQGNSSGMFEWHIQPRLKRNQSPPHPKGLGSGCGLEYYEAIKEGIEAAFKLI